MKAGAHDYVMKDNLKRLGPAVNRELREAEERRERRRGEERLKVEHSFRRAVENSVPAGISAVDLDGRQTYVNPAFCRMVGWSESDLVGAQPPFAFWPPEEVDGITEALGRFLDGSAPASGVELRFRRRNGERFHVLLQVTPLKDSFGNVTGYVSAASDINERKHAEIRLAAEHAITRILANAQTLDEAAPGILQVLLDSLEVDFGALWFVDSKHSVLVPQVMNLRNTSSNLKSFLEESRRKSFALGTGSPGKVWETRSPVWQSDLSQQEDFERRELAARAGLRSMVAFPVQNAGDFFGLLEFFSTRVLEPDRAVINMMNAIGSEIGQFIQRRSAEEALRRAHDELEIRVQQRTAELKTANTRLQSSIAERKRLENELLEITEKERRRIGLDLHDDLGQRLSGMALMTKGLELRLQKLKLSEAADAGRIHELVHEAMNHTSDLAHDLATLDLKEKDLGTALDELAAHAKDMFGINCKYKVNGTIPQLDASVTKQLYKIAQEALTNAIKHGKAKRVTLSIDNEPNELVLTIQNSGLPFPDLEGHSTGMGLRIMNYRSSLIGGSLEIKGASNGTIVRCALPLTK
jgi:PAS domain S-box-containing protein